MNGDKKFLSIPLSFSSDEENRRLETEEGRDGSIDALIDLIVFTPKGSFPADPEFGFEYWNHEFSNLNVREFNNSYIGLIHHESFFNEVSRRQCEESLKESIAAYEPRLLNPEVKIELEINDKVMKKRNRSKYMMKIVVTGGIDDGLGVEKTYEKKISFLVEPVAKKISI